MNDSLVERWNARVKPDDTVYHLGDFSWGHPDTYLARLNGKVTLILGNHDVRNRCVKAGFANVLEMLLTKIGSRPVFMFHYPCLSWPSRTHKSWHLFGHVHGRLQGKCPKLSIDVGVDVHDYQPVSYDELKKLIESAPDNNATTSTD